MAPYPLFQKELPPSAVFDRPCYPTEHLHVLPFEGDELEVRFQCELCGDGSVITLGCTRRRINDPKPVFTRELWSEIVRRGNLQPGDRLTFFIDDEGYPRPRYKIMVERRGIRLFGQMIYDPSASNWLLVI